MNKVLQMDRRGHAMSGMDAIYLQVTPEMRKRLCDTLELFWQEAITKRTGLSPYSAVPIFDQILGARRHNPQRRESGQEPIP